jgi:hypothetical protein
LLVFLGYKAAKVRLLRQLTYTKIVTNIDKHWVRAT